MLLEARVQGGIYGFWDGGSPTLSIILSCINGPTVGSHLCLSWTFRNDHLWLSRELSGERDLFPTLSTILGVQQQRRLAHNPNLIPVHRDGLKSVADVLTLAQVRKGSRHPSLTTIFGLLGSTKSGSWPVNSMKISGERPLFCKTNAVIGHH